MEFRLRRRAWRTRRELSGQAAQQGRAEQDIGPQVGLPRDVLGTGVARQDGPAPPGQAALRRRQAALQNRAFRLRRAGHALHVLGKALQQGGVDRLELHGRAGRLLAQPFQPRVVRSQQRRRRLEGDPIRAHGGLHPIQTSTAATTSSPARIGGTGLARLISLMTRLQSAHRYFLNRATVRWTK